MLIEDLGIAALADLTVGGLHIHVPPEPRDESGRSRRLGRGRKARSTKPLPEGSTRTAFSYSCAAQGNTVREGTSSSLFWMWLVSRCARSIPVAMAFSSTSHALRRRHVGSRAESTAADRPPSLPSRTLTGTAASGRRSRSPSDGFSHAPWDSGRVRDAPRFHAVYAMGAGGAYTACTTRLPGAAVFTPCTFGALSPVQDGGGSVHSMQRDPSGDGHFTPCTQPWGPLCTPHASRPPDGRHPRLSTSGKNR